MDLDLEPLHSQVMEAKFPEDVFGASRFVLPTKVLLEELEKKYLKLKNASNPKHYSSVEDIEAAQDTSRRLNQLYEKAKTRIESGIYGIEGYGSVLPAYAQKYFTIGPNRYHLGHLLIEKEYYRLYEGFLEREGVILGEVLIRVVTDPAKNHLARKEARNLDILHGQDVPQWKHLPFLMDRFESGGRVGLVYRKISGFTLSEVRRHRVHANGVDQKHMVWMIDRLLSCLGYVQRCGIVHGCMSPETVSIQPSSHNLIVNDWECAVHRPAISGEKIAAVPSLFTAPEVSAGGEVGPWSDIYSAGKLMIWILGGNPGTNEIPREVEAKIQTFLGTMVHEDPLARPSDAWDLYREQAEIKDSLWDRKFLNFDMT